MTWNWDEYNQSEKPALDLFDTLGYKVYDQLKKDFTELPARESEHQVILIEELKSALKRINPWINENNLNKAVNKIRPARLKANSLMSANEMIYDKLINHISLQQDVGYGKKNQTVKYIDYDNLDNNSFFVTVNLEDLKFTPYGEEREFVFKLPGSKKTVRFGYLDGHKEKRLASLREPNISSAMLIRILDIDGKAPSKKSLSEMSMRDRNALRQEMSRVDAGIDTSVETECDGCGTKIRTRLEAEPSFLFPGVRL
ncbi:type I restriction and modification enzyme subunit R-like protein [Halanaerobium congolense]|jgi:hypothetical protein|uniref:type I site-specific deoxyribonuclease n=1 Tax=Halanaerobium congolense TaxID=54121 RepID=A0A318E3W6_9FIRM|nr:type I restriction endonuclease [Halanaerobium congolense]PXV62047.1 type I restriction and modification enzyme subunit R-like protein [Halanaerobium congolense]TDX37676.1 type I restriction and modification enzyme subunit R-like protein [Halanaerobium congolense]